MSCCFHAAAVLRPVAGQQPDLGRPEVIEGPHNPRPQDLGADYLGT
ncbi:hypothetical protein FLP41_20640 [Paracoccus marcusii]|nr:hypothetical protein FLP41_20640 [Paracoccus marcusii]